MSTEIEAGLMSTTHYVSPGLRFIEREVEVGEGVARKVRFLQQLYLPINGIRGEEEWRDVPLVEV